MELTRKLRLRLLAQNSVFLALLVVLVMLLAYLAREYREEWDITRAGRNSLSVSTLELLKQIEGPLHVTAYAMTLDAAGANVHRRIEERLRAYQRAKPDIALTLVDPREDPKRAETAGIRTPNELVVEYRRRSERLSEFNEQAFANVLMRLARGAERLVLWLDGHGERKLNGPANQDLGEFGRNLEARGFRVSSVNLSLAQEVPANAALLLIAGPCVIESEELTLSIARQLKALTADLSVQLVFKASFDKANRTSLSSFRGPGIENGPPPEDEPEAVALCSFANVFSSWTGSEVKSSTFSTCLSKRKIETSSSVENAPSRAGNEFLTF